MSRHDDSIRIAHMRDHALEALTIAEGRVRADLDSDRLLELGLTRLVEIVGEAASRVSGQTQAELAEIPWADIIGMRHRIVHGYDRIDRDILWDTITEDIEPLIPLLNDALRCLGQPEDS
jgi:uncharacterized protein with HEPN domain